MCFVANKHYVNYLFDFFNLLEQETIKVGRPLCTDLIVGTIPINF